jgi:hypothetical protein
LLLVLLELFPRLDVRFAAMGKRTVWLACFGSAVGAAGSANGSAAGRWAGAIFISAACMSRLASRNSAAIRSIAIVVQPQTSPCSGRYSGNTEINDGNEKGPVSHEDGHTPSFGSNAYEAGRDC